MNALESEALASTLSPAGRRVLLGLGGGRGGVHLGLEGEEGLAVGWSLLPACSFTSKPQCVRGPRILLSCAGWTVVARKGTRSSLQSAGLAHCCAAWVQTLLQGARSRACGDAPVSMVCPVSSARAASANTCPYCKKGLSK